MCIVPFFKMSGSGNDFIIIEKMNFDFSQTDLSVFAKSICSRRLSIGADGLIIIEKSKISDFKWNFFNSDGTSSAMCGNGARCVARYAHINSLAGKKMTFETDAGIIYAEINDTSVKIKVTNPKSLKLCNNITHGRYTFFLDTVNTGVPHAVMFVKNIEDVDVIKIGRTICHHEVFQPECINVNFVEVLNNHSVFVRTYERGIEDETLACGTGNLAVAIMCAIHYKFKSPIVLTNASGSKLKVFFNKNGFFFKDVFLEGVVRVIYQGLLWEEGCKYFQT